MFDIFCVTNRKLCKENFIERIRKIAKSKPAGIILREKDLPEAEYKIIAEKVIEICKAENVECIIHNFVNTALELDCNSLHLPLPVLCRLSDDIKKRFKNLGASCHSVEEALNAQKMGCTYITAGHIFNTDCKKGLPGRGIDFLKSICENVPVPVYAIGGICADNIDDIRKVGASGAFVMSGAMTCENVSDYFESLRSK